MDFPVRRKGKPNREGGKRRGGGRGGGSRGGRSRAQGGGGGSRKSSSKAWDEGDDICFSSRPMQPPKFQQASRRISRPHNPVVSTPLQTLQMTTENQERVKALLRDLQGQDLDAEIDDVGSELEDEYDSVGSQEEGEEDNAEEDLQEDESFNYWSSAQETVLAGNLSQNSPAQLLPEAVISPFAIGKLSRYGFDRERCLTALRSHDGDVGVSLEYLLQQCLSEAFGIQTKTPRTASDFSMEECIERREEEAFVLRSICGEKFIERIPNKVWTIGLQMDYLMQRLKPQKRENEKNLSKHIPNNVCRFYVKGEYCRFGSKCRFKHEAPNQNIKDESHLHANGDSNYLYELEIRFPKDNKYPYQAPLLAFYSVNENLSMACRLHITEYLYGKSLNIAQNNEPVVYTLVNCLEDEHEVVKLLANTQHKYSIPPPLLLPAPTEARKPHVITANKPRALAHVSRVAREHKPEKAEVNNPNGTDEDDGNDLESESVLIENESYAHFKKKQSKKYLSSLKPLLAENAKICKHYRAKKATRMYQSMLQQRQKLPAWQEQDQILNHLSKNQVLVVSGMTGCGKTTQIPQFILDASLEGPPCHLSNIICTQPRRISAISVAERVAQERAERVGISVGYQIRLESVKSAATRLLYCTTGVLLRRLEGDTALHGVTHVIVDEVHERTEESDFLLLVLKDVMIQRPELKIILMSATLNADLFSQYFQDCPVIHIPGRTFPVDQYFLEDAIAKTRYVLEDGSPYQRSSKHLSSPDSAWGKKGKSYGELMDELEQDISSSLKFQESRVKDSVPDQQLNFKELSSRYSKASKTAIKTLCAMDLEKPNLELIEALLEWIVNGEHSYPSGAVLVFLPGLAEIKMLYEQLQSNALFNNRRSKKYDPGKSMESLEDTWVSRANAMQRKGRAGRVASGVCFHLFTSHHYHHQLLDQQPPEIQRIPLEQLCLRIKILEMFSECLLESVLARLIEPPRMESLHASKLRLQDLGALTKEEKLTPLGYHLASLPVDVRIGKLMLFGAIFRCLDPALTIAASLAFKSPFVCPWDKKEEANKKKQEFAIANSDHLALLQAYKTWSSVLKESPRVGYQYCRDNFLSARVLQEISSLKRQFTELLSDIGFVTEGLRARDIEKRWAHRGDGILEATGEEANANAENIKLISAMLCAALYPNVVQVKSPEGKFQVTRAGAVKMQPKSEEFKFVTRNDGYVHIHPSSINYQVRHFDSPYLVYHEKIKTSRVFVRDCSMVSVYPLVLFGGGQINVDLRRGEFIISLDDGWIRFAAASHQVAELVKELRSELDQLLQDKIKNPTMDLCTCPRGSRIIAMIVKLVTTQ
ncbi:hypothetical protein GDO86_009340 [Hymenochirus boettgeri]|uniref:RNA helicase n=1 Tax=Hymenochirus boettgeri TaxID=247094 RepID=A0A8T2JK71_9PIPI|nr:hypothetical protein GDO86_009340 [Hymenochirus boettgeri]